jgi:hypothetical protein
MRGNFGMCLGRCPWCQGWCAFREAPPFGAKALLMGSINRNFTVVLFVKPYSSAKRRFPTSPYSYV